MRTSFRSIGVGRFVIGFFGFFGKLVFLILGIGETTRGFVRLIGGNVFV